MSSATATDCKALRIRCESLVKEEIEMISEANAVGWAGEGLG